MEQLKWHEYMYPIIKILSDKKIRHRNEIKDLVAELLKLPDEIKNERLIKTPNVFVCRDRMGWALTYLKQSGLISSPTRAHYTITADGEDLLKEKQTNGTKVITKHDLEKYDGYKAFKSRTRTKKNLTHKTSYQEQIDTPDEMILNAEQQIREHVCSELLENARKMHHSDFEALVIDLLVKMGYSDNSESLNAIRTGGAGDCGIDGVIYQDRLGLDAVYIQAKRFKENNNVTPHDVRDFTGALIGTGSKKGVFITTSNFTKEGFEHVKKTPGFTIILIDGQKLAELMYEYNVGVTPKKEIVIKKIDSDYFDE